MCSAFANCPSYDIEMNLFFLQMSQYPFRVHQLMYCPCNMRPMHTHEGACTRFTPLQHVAWCVPTFSLRASPVGVELSRESSRRLKQPNLPVFCPFSAEKHVTSEQYSFSRLLNADSLIQISERGTSCMQGSSGLAGGSPFPPSLLSPLEDRASKYVV